MTTAKSVKKASPGKPAAPLTLSSAAKAKPVTKAKRMAQPGPIGKVSALPKAATAKPVRTSASEPAAIPAEQRRNYIEMAAYYIAERRGFAAGNPLDDWTRAEAEIDHLLAEGLLGR